MSGLLFVNIVKLRAYSSEILGSFIDGVKFSVISTPLVLIKVKLLGKES